MTDGPNSPHAAAIQEVLAAAPNYYAWIDRAFGDALGGRVLEVGPGGGHMTRRLLARPGVASIEALEPDPAYRARLARAFPGVVFHPHRAEDPAVRGLGPYDAVACLNVLEHIDDDEAALANAAAVLAPGGRLCLLVPALPFLFGTMDAADLHRRRYRRAEVREKVERAGLEIASLRYFNLPGVFGWWWAGRVLRRDVIPRSGLTFYDRIIPWVEVVERLVPPPIGQSLLVVARRPAAASDERTAPTRNDRGR